MIASNNSWRRDYLGSLAFLIVLPKVVLYEINSGIWDKWEVVLYPDSYIEFIRATMTSILSILAILALLIEVAVSLGNRTRDGGRGWWDPPLAPGWNQATLIDTGGLSLILNRKRRAAQKKKRPRNHHGCASLASRRGLSLTSHVVSRGRRPCWKLKTISQASHYPSTH